MVNVWLVSALATRIKNITTKKAIITIKMKIKEPVQPVPAIAMTTKSIRAAVSARFLNQL